MTINFTSLLHIIFLLCLLTPLTLKAGREPESWDTLPAINEIVFSSGAVGFASSDGRKFRLDRFSKYFFKMTSSEFETEFGSASKRTVSSFIENRGINSLVLIKTSAGINLETSNAYCAEGENIRHSLKINGKKIEDQAQPCSTITCAEIDGDYLWLGTRTDGEYGEYPGEGLIIQYFKNGSLIKTVSQNDGLTGNLIRAIRLDPYSKNIWTASYLGLDELSPKGEILFSGYFMESFNTETGEPSIFLSSAPAKSDQLAILGRKLGLKNFQDYYDAVKKIPDSVRNCFRPYTWDQVSSCPGGDTGFLPDEFQPLVPFLISAIKSGIDEYMREGLFQACFFKHEKLAELFSDLEADPVMIKKWRFYLTPCSEKYAAAGIIGEKKKAERRRILLKRVAQGLSSYNLAIMKKEPLPDYETEQSIIESAKSLLNLGDKSGMNLINEHFAHSSRGNNDLDSILFEDIAQQLYNYNEILPGILAGIRKFYGAPAGQGCFYLDMTYQDESKQPKLQAENIRAILEAAENGSRPETVPHQPSQAAGAYSSCMKALKSQLKNKAVRTGFMEKFYPGLPVNLKILADKALLDLAI